MITLLHTLVVDPLKEVYGYLAGFVPTLVSAVFILIVGIILARVVHDMIRFLLKTIKFDHYMDKLGVTDTLKKGGVKHTVGDLFASLVHLVIIVTFLVKTVTQLGIIRMTELYGEVTAYIPQVITAVFILVLGILVAKIISKMISAVTAIAGMPNPKLTERVSRWAIMITAGMIALRELGLASLLEGTSFQIIFGGIVLAFALAFGMGGKDKASKYLSRRE